MKVPFRLVALSAAMGVATTTDTTGSVRTSFEILKNLYGMSVQVDETTNKENRGKISDLEKKVIK